MMYNTYFYIYIYAFGYACRYTNRFTHTYTLICIYIYINTWFLPMKDPNWIQISLQMKPVDSMTKSRMCWRYVACHPTHTTMAGSHQKIRKVP